MDQQDIEDFKEAIERMSDEENKTKDKSVKSHNREKLLEEYQQEASQLEKKNIELKIENTFLSCTVDSEVDRAVDNTQYHGHEIVMASTLDIVEEHGTLGNGHDQDDLSSIFSEDEEELRRLVEGDDSIRKALRNLRKERDFWITDTASETSDDGDTSVSARSLRDTAEGRIQISKLMADKEFLELKLSQVTNDKKETETKLRFMERETEGIKKRRRGEAQHIGDSLKNPESIHSYQTEGAMRHTKQDHTKQKPRESQKPHSHGHQHRDHSTRTGMTDAELIKFLRSRSISPRLVKGYEDDIALLAEENERLGEIIDHLHVSSDNEQTPRPDPMEEFMNAFENRVSKEEYLRLESEKMRLEQGLREKERQVKERDRIIEESKFEFEDELKLLKEALKRMEEKMRMRAREVNEYEIKIIEIKSSFEEQLRNCENELSLENEEKMRLEEINIDLGETNRKCQKENENLKIHLARLEHKEKEIEKNYSNDLRLLEEKFLNENREKTQLSGNLEGLMTDLMVLKNKLLEESNKTGRLREGFEKERTDLGGSSFTVNPKFSRLAIGINLRNRLGQESRVQTSEEIISEHHANADKTETKDVEHIVDNSLQAEPDVSKYVLMIGEQKQMIEALEKANQELGAKLNERQNQQPTPEETREVILGENLQDQLDFNNNRGSRPSSSLKFEVDDLQQENIYLKQKLEDLGKEKMKRRELKEKNEELQEDIIHTERKRNELQKKQDTMNNEIEEMNEKIEELEKSNSKLMKEADRLTKRLIEMEENFNEEKANLSLSYQKEKEVSEKELNEALHKEHERFQDMETEIEHLRDEVEQTSNLKVQHSQEIEHIKNDNHQELENERKIASQLRNTVERYEEELKRSEEEKRRLLNRPTQEVTQSTINKPDSQSTELDQNYLQKSEPLQDNTQQSAPLQKYHQNPEPLQDNTQQSVPLQSFHQNPEPLQDNIQQSAPLQNNHQNPELLQDNTQQSVPLQSFHQNPEPLQDNIQQSAPLQNNHQNPELLQDNTQQSVPLQSFHQNPEPLQDNIQQSAPLYSYHQDSEPLQNQKTVVVESPHDSQLAAVQSSPRYVQQIESEISYIQETVQMVAQEIPMGTEALPVETVSKSTPSNVIEIALPLEERNPMVTQEHVVQSVSNLGESLPPVTKVNVTENKPIHQRVQADNGIEVKYTSMVPNLHIQVELEDKQHASDGVNRDRQIDEANIKKLEDERNQLRSSLNQNQNEMNNLSGIIGQLKQQLMSKDQEIASLIDKERNAENVFQNKLEKNSKYYQGLLENLKEKLQAEKKELEERLNKESEEMQQMMKEEFQKHLSSKSGQLENKIHELVADKVREYKEQIQKLEVLVENERQKCGKFESGEDERTVRLQREKKVLRVTIQALTKELNKEKQERKDLKKEYKKGRAEAKKTSEEEKKAFTETLERAKEVQKLKIEEELRNKYRLDVEKYEQKLDALNGEIQQYENRIEEMVIKCKEDKFKLENDLQDSVVELECMKENQTEFRVTLEEEYHRKLRKEKETIESTLESLRQEIARLRDHRKQLESQLLQQAHYKADKNSGYNTTHAQSSESILNNKEIFTRIELEYQHQLQKEKDYFENKIQDLERDYESLHEEISRLKIKHRQERMVMKSEFEKEKGIVEDRLEKEKRELQLSMQLRMQSIRDPRMTSQFLDRDRGNSVNQRNRRLQTEVDILQGKISRLEVLSPKMIDVAQRSQLYATPNRTIQAGYSQNYEHGSVMTQYSTPFNTESEQNTHQFDGDSTSRLHQMMPSNNQQAQQAQLAQQAQPNLQQPIPSSVGQSSEASMGANMKEADNMAEDARTEGETPSYSINSSAFTDSQNMSHIETSEEMVEMIDGPHSNTTSSEVIQGPIDPQL